MMLVKYNERLLNLKWAKEVAPIGKTEIWITWGPHFRETGSQFIMAYPTEADRDRVMSHILRQADFDASPKTDSPQKAKTVWRLKNTFGEYVYYTNVQYESALKATNALISFGNPTGVHVVQETVYE